MPLSNRLLATALPLMVISSAAIAEPADLSYEAYWIDAASERAFPDGAIDLEAIAASDPSLTFVEGEHGEPDAMSMLSDVLFEFGRADLAPEALDTLDGVAKKLSDVEGLQIVGHTDSIGTEALNLSIGMARAESVRDWFLAQGYLSDNAIQIESMGEAQPIAENVTSAGFDNAEGRALNRRVEFRIVKRRNGAALSAIETTHPTVF